MLSLREFKSHEMTIALFLCQKVKRGEVEAGQAQDPSIKAILCFADKAMITDLF